MKDSYDKDSILECYNIAFTAADSNKVCAAISVRRSDYEMQREYESEKQEAITPVHQCFYEKYDELETVADTHNTSALITFASILPDQAERHNLTSVFHLLNSGKLTDRLKLAGSEIRIAAQMEPNNPRTQAIARVVAELGALNDKMLQKRWRTT